MPAGCAVACEALLGQLNVHGLGGRKWCNKWAEGEEGGKGRDEESRQGSRGEEKKGKEGIERKGVTGGRVGGLCHSQDDALLCYSNQAPNKT